MYLYQLLPVPDVPVCDVLVPDIPVPDAAEKGLMRKSWEGCSSLNVVSFRLCSSPASVLVSAATFEQKFPAFGETMQQGED